MADRVTHLLDDDDDDDDDLSQKEASRLCKVCNQIGTSDTRWLINTKNEDQSSLDIYIHRRDWNSLKDSAVNGCRLCQLILSTVVNSDASRNLQRIIDEVFQDCVSGSQRTSIPQEHGRGLSSDLAYLLPTAFKNLEVTYGLHRLSQLCGNGRVLLIRTGSANTLPASLRAVVLWLSGAFDIRDAYKPFVTGLPLELVTGLDDPLAPLATAWTVSPTLFTDSLVHRIRGWRDECLSRHSKCRGMRGPQPLPSRLIDVSVGEVHHTVKLRDTRGEHGIYAALSYCWGNHPQKTTVKSTLREHLVGISVSKLPATIQDAIRLCQLLEIQYLWVDSLCIVQDDSEDWHHEAAEMASIYGRSALTITTPQNNHCDESFNAIGTTRQGSSLPQLKWTHRNEEKTVAGTVTVRENALTSGDDPPFPYSSGQINSPWMARGWTMQEWLLSPRVLHCGRERVWDCYQTWHSETTFSRASSSGGLNDRDLASHIFSRMTRLDPTILQSGLDTHWARLVEDFTSRSLTREMDKMPAIAGLATKFMEHSHAKAPGAKYLAGLWDYKGINPFGGRAYPTSQLPLGLLWRRSSVEHMRSPASYRAPSWSWASLDGPVSLFRLEWLLYDLFGTNFGFQDFKKMEVINATCLFDPPDSCSPVQTGWIIGTSPLKRAYINPSWRITQFHPNLESEYHKAFVGLGTERGREETPWFGIFDQSFEQTGVHHVDESLCLLHVATVMDIPEKGQLPNVVHHALIVEKVGSYDNIECFRRLGVAWSSLGKGMEHLNRIDPLHFDWSDQNMLKDWEVHKVRLI